MHDTVCATRLRNKNFGLLLTFHFIFLSDFPPVVPSVLALVFDGLSVRLSIHSF